VLHAFKKQVTLIVLNLRRVEKAQVEIAPESEATGFGQTDISRLGDQERRNPVDLQCFCQALYRLIQQRVDVDLGPEVTRKIQKRPAIVIAFPVEEPIELRLDTRKHRLKQEGCNHNGQQPSALARDQRVVAEKVGKQKHQPEVETDDRCGCQGVRNSAAENHVNIHQAVSNNGVAKRQREQHERKNGKLQPFRWNESHA